MPAANIPTAPHIAPNVRVGISNPDIEPSYYGPKAHLNSKLSAVDSTPTSSSAVLLKTPAIKSPVPAKPLPLESYTMSAATTPSPEPTSTNAQTSRDGLFGWSIPAEAALFVVIALVCITIPAGLFMCLRRRKRRQAHKFGQESPSSPSSSSSGSTFDGHGELAGSFTRPTTASSTWLETLKHTTETPAPPHACENPGDTYCEPPKPIVWRKFYPKKRLSDAEIEQEVRELEEEVKRKSRASRASRASKSRPDCMLPEVEGACGECALAYTTDERGHTQPVEGRKATPIPFLGSLDLDPSPLEEVVKADEIRIVCAEIPIEVDLTGDKTRVESPKA